MADLQEGQCGRGEGINCVTLNWRYTVYVGRMRICEKETANECKTVGRKIKAFKDGQSERLSVLVFREIGAVLVMC